MINLRDIDLNLLVVFQELFQERRVSSAAERLQLSQSAVSNALTRLRRTFGDDLFVAMHDPTLLGRLGHIGAPTLVIWGASDRIFTPAYGRAMAAAIPGARFELVAAAGHLPHLEQPDAVFGLIDHFLG